MTPDQSVSFSLDRWKEHLLDTSKRNRLLFFKPESAVQLLEPDLETLWKRLVKSPRPQSFFGLESQTDPLAADLESDEETATPPRRALKSDEIFSSPSGPKLLRALYSLRSKSNLSLEEQGLSTLYVAWGFLRWRDVKSGEEIVSPLVLSPMTLMRESAGATYKLKLHEEDLWLNPVLQWKFASDFKIALPELPDWEDADIFNYFDRVRDAVHRQSGWNVWEAAYLGLFSFHKMAMYQDLREGEERAKANPFVRALGGDSSRLPSLPLTLARAPDLDSIPVAQSFGVLNCDSSQGESVQAAKAGASFVLQGPPGTGKSQTIANIIAECLAGGKRVLFVSEKMAALDVVHERLKGAGLDLFCLKAHSQSASKKEVIADLGKTLAAARTGAQIAALQSAQRQDGAESAELERLRSGLNLYARELHTPRSLLNFSVYEACGELALRSNVPEIAAPLPSPFGTEAANLSRWRELLGDAAHNRAVWSAGALHPFWGVKARPYSLDLGTTVRSHAQRGVAASEALKRGANSWARACGVLGADESADFSLAACELLPQIALLLGELESGRVRRPSATWLVCDELEPLLALAHEFKTRFEAAGARRAALNARYSAPFWELPHLELIERATSRGEAVLARGGTWEEFPAWSDEAIDRLERVALLLQTTHKASFSLAAALGFAPPTTLQSAGQFANALLVLQGEWTSSRRIEPSWLDARRLPELRAACKQAKTVAQKRDAGAEKLGDYDLNRLRDADLVSLSRRFETDYASFLRVLKGSFRADMKQLASFRHDGNKAAFAAALQELQNALVWQESAQWLYQAANSHRADFGSAYAGEQTNWLGIERDLEACERVVTAFAPLGGVSSGAMQKLASGIPAGDLLGSLPTLCAALSPLREELLWLGVVFSLRDLPFERDGASLSSPVAPLSEFAAWLSFQASALRDVAGALERLGASQIENNPSPTRLVADAREALEVFRLERELEGESGRLQSQFFAFFEGERTNWNALLSALSWTSRASSWWRAWNQCGGRTGENCLPSGDFIALSLGEKRFQPPAEALPLVEAREQWAYFDALFEREITPSNSLQDDQRWFQLRLDGAPRLEDLLRWLQTETALEQEGLLPFWDEVRRLDLDEDAVPDAFEKRFWSLWLDAALRESPSLAGFSGARHNSQIERFAALDEASLAAARRRLGELLWSRKPTSSTGNTKAGEMANLQKEANKKARQKPLRRLFREIPHLLGALKPCFLMSPLAVAQFLEAERAAFDLVIFDEASQICPEDAVGSIMRAAQIVVVGDRKQLPPSRFFASGATDSDDDDEAEDESAVFESILDMCAPHLPNYMLLWHYRSRDETLIAFSNQHFYDGRLITFPGPHIGGANGRGVRFEGVTGTYFRGKHRDARTNPREAQRVAELVIEHFERAPGSSLGVIALGASQARAIDEAVTKQIQRKPHLEPLVATTRRERFFVKALENVQGDERDAIILSIGFGPDENGKISMNFGPLNREGGERRLNVAVTRAKDSFTVVSSLRPEDIDPSRTSANGPKLLRSYLEMARRGGDFSVAQSDLESDGVVDAIESALRERGWKTARGVGRSALKIDIAVEDPRKAGEFLLGIECDGSDYLAAPTARDRDRLRPGVLHDLGWTLTRVWSLDWLKNPGGELARLETLLHNLLNPPASAPSSAPVRAFPEEAPGDEPPTLPAQETLPLRVGFSPFETFDGGEDDDSPFAGVLLDSIAVQNGQPDVFPAESARGFFGFDSKGVQPQTVPGDMEEAPENIRSATRLYEPVELGHLGWQDEFRALGARDSGLQNAIWKVVEAEWPVHINSVIRRVSAAYGFARSSDLIGGKIIRGAKDDARFDSRGLYLWPKKENRAPVRVPKPGAEPRRADEISGEEWGEASLLCLRDAFGMEKSELVAATARLMGFARTGAVVSGVALKGLELMLKSGRLVERDGAMARGELDSG